MRSVRFILAIGIAVTLLGCSEEQKAPMSTSPQSASVEAGEKLFQENCSECHPRSGRGDYLQRIPVTLLTRKSQHELMEWIKGAGQHREMPSFESLSDEERASLADYLHSQIMK